ncbi:MAG: hypothetical protein OES20_12700 [Gammaproteobacteria bacterium]|nr:hypothetical protein [Gammaproteobacteria bacterium]
MKEADWKIFKEIKEKALGSFCENAFSEFTEIIENESEHIHDRYLKLYKLVHEKDKELSDIFDGHSRSKAAFQLLLIRKMGLADKGLLQKISDEFAEETDPGRLR